MGAGTAENTSLQLPNPFVEYTSMEEAVAAAGFDMAVPETLFDMPIALIRVMEDKLIEVVYDGGGQKITLRKAPGESDISGDYTLYSWLEVANVDGKAVTFKGADGAITVALWAVDGYSYAVRAEVALDRELMESVIDSIDALHGGLIGLPNPFVPCDTLADAAAVAGFALALPLNIADSQCTISAIADSMIQIVCTLEKGELCIRKAIGDSDISGDYTVYAQEDVITVNDAAITLKGNDGNVIVATWTDGEYAYALRMAEGMSADEWQPLLTACVNL